MPYKDALRVIDYQRNNICAVLVSHTHQDHIKYITEYLKNGIPAYISYETAEQSGVLAYTYLLKFVKSRQLFKVGQYTIMPFDLRHDVTNFGYYIQHPECGRLVFITDTHYCPYTFAGLNNIILECNYSEERLQYNVLNNLLHPSLARRIRYSHMGLETAMDFLKANDLSKLNNLILIHISNSNADGRQISDKVRHLTGKTPVLADRNMCIEFNQTPF